MEIIIVDLVVPLFLLIIFLQKCGGKIRRDGDPNPLPSRPNAVTPQQIRRCIKPKLGAVVGGAK